MHDMMADAMREEEVDVGDVANERHDVGNVPSGSGAPAVLSGADWGKIF